MNKTIVFMVALFAMLGAAPALADDITQCALIDTAGTYTMVNDIYADTYNATIGQAVEYPFCFHISSDNVIFDCDGYTITGGNFPSSSGGFFPIFMRNGLSMSNITIRNCNIYANSSTVINTAIGSDVINDFTVENTTLINNGGTIGTALQFGGGNNLLYKNIGILGTYNDFGFNLNNHNNAVFDNVVMNGSFGTSAFNFGEYDYNNNIFVECDFLNVGSVFMRGSNLTILESIFLNSPLTHGYSVSTTLISSSIFDNSDINFDNYNINFYNNYVNDSTISNYVNVQFNTTLQNGARIYGNGTLIGGNYWVGHTEEPDCNDTNTDGICDEPYDIFGDASAYDYLPLGDDYAEVEIPTNVTCDLYLNGVTNGGTLNIMSNETLNITALVSNYTDDYWEIFQNGISYSQLVGLSYDEVLPLNQTLNYNAEQNQNFTLVFYSEGLLNGCNATVDLNVTVLVPPCVYNTAQCFDGFAGVCDGNGWINVTCQYGCTDYGRVHCMSSVESITSSSGQGLGALLSGITLPVGNFILLLAAISGVLAIFYAISYGLDTILKKR